LLALLSVFQLIPIDLDEIVIILHQLLAYIRPSAVFQFIPEIAFIIITDQDDPVTSPSAGGLVFFSYIATAIIGAFSQQERGKRKAPDIY